MSRTLLSILLVLVVAFNHYSQCNADVMVTYSPANVIAVGEQHTTIDVYLSSNSNDAMNSFGAEFLITPVNSTGGRLKFSTPQLSSQLDDLNYAMSSYGYVYGTLPGSQVLTTFNVDDTYRAYDMALVLRFPTIIPMNTNKLLFRLDLDGSDTMKGDIFNIRLLNNSRTGFGTPLFAGSIVVDPRSFSNAGVVLVSVPEPFSISLTLFSLLFVVAIYIRKGLTTNVTQS